MRFRRCVVGGTFSILHEGHRELLRVAARAAREVVVGIVTDEYAASMNKGHPVEEYSFRALNVLLYLLREIGDGQRIAVVPLDDPYGPALSEEVDLIVVSEETFPRALEINSIRVSRGLRPLTIKCIGMVHDGRGHRISSSRLWAMDLHRVPGHPS